jgi:hypothetical protein
MIMSSLKELHQLDGSSLDGRSDQAITGQHTRPRSPQLKLKELMDFVSLRPAAQDWKKKMGGMENP